jgi:hypothetical protein
MRQIRVVSLKLLKPVAVICFRCYDKCVVLWTYLYELGGLGWMCCVSRKILTLYIMKDRAVEVGL